MKRNGFLAVLAICTVSLLTSGCAGYRLGSMLPADIKTVYVPTFVNKTREPLIEVQTTQKAIQEFQRDGSLKVASRETADAILEVTILDYDTVPVRYDSDRRSTAETYRLWLTAQVVMKRTKDGTVIAENARIRGQTVFEVFGDLTSSKTRALPLAAEDLAHNIVETVVEVW